MKDDDTWAPNFMAQFTAGITDNIGKLRTASLLAAQSVGSGMNMGSLPSGGNNAMVGVLNQILGALRQQSSQGSIGRSALPGNLGSVTQQFGPVSFNGVQNMQQLYAQLNKLAGYAGEDSQRGATSGLGY